jgi:hypothetical protein
MSGISGLAWCRRKWIGSRRVGLRRHSPSTRPCNAGEGTEPVRQLGNKEDVDSLLIIGRVAESLR